MKGISVGRALLLGILVIAFSVILGAPAQAGYSGLVMIPTADILDRGEWCVELQHYGQFASGSEDTRLLNTQFGVHPRLEVGLDFDLSDSADSRVMGNAKYLLIPSSGKNPAVAVGFADVCSGGRSCRYASMTRNFHACRGHAGFMRIEGTNRWFVGADREVSDRITLMADYISGRENQSSIGIEYAMTDYSSILVGVLFPNDGSEKTGFSVLLALPL